MDTKQQQKNSDSFLREWTFPEEDRSKYTSRPWSGGFRWFRSPNVVCLEQERYRRQRQIPQKPPQKPAA
jgi:hypothetical protein